MVNYKVNYIYISGVASNNKYNELVGQGIIRKLPQAQKYHRLLIEGIRKNIDGRLIAVSAFPTNRKWTKKYFFRGEYEIIDRVEYYYPLFINLPVLRQLFIAMYSFTVTFKYARKYKNTAVICDILTKANSLGARIACKILSLSCVGVVTDVPGKTSGARRKTLSKSNRKILELLEKYSSRNIDKYDAYLFLTEAMNEIINLKHKPYIILEGHSDINMSTMVNSLYNKNSKKTILYSGGIHEEFGIKILIEAFNCINNEEWELHIYGDGNYEKQLEMITQQNSNIKYFGVVSNDVIIEKQIKAHILINPRLTSADYIKYSFPSKNLEYMASGTPTLTTVLPGMPQEYFDYVYLIVDESISGFISSIRDIMNIPIEILHNKGLEAREFVLNKKNNVIQAKKFVNFIENNLRVSL